MALRRETEDELAARESPSSNLGSTKNNLCTPGRVNRVGMAASLTLREAAVMSMWGVRGPGGGFGCRLATSPSASGAVLAAMICRPCGDSAPSVAGASSDGTPASSAAGRSLLLEVSASIPVADGICLTPGLVAVRQRGGQASVALAMQSSWCF